MTKIAAVSVLPLAVAAYASGYAVSGVRKGSRALRRIFRWDWRTVTHGPLEVRTPPTWGEIEQASDGMLILHNLPARLRVDGDAVWYGSTVEIRIYRDGEIRPTVDSASRCWKRRLGSPEAPLIADLVVANGVRPTKRREAQMVLRSLRLTADPASIVWPVQSKVSATLRRITPPHNSNIARDFESF